MDEISRKPTQSKITLKPLILNRNQTECKHAYDWLDDSEEHVK